MDHMEVERHQHHHDQGRRMRYPDHDMRNHGADTDLRSKFLHLQQRCKGLLSEQEKMQNQVAKATEERDKYKSKLEQSWTQHTQMQNFIQKLKFENEQQAKQLHHKNAEVEQRYSRVLEELDTARSDLECAIQDRDGFKYQMKELQRENQRVNDKYKAISPNFEASRKELEAVKKERDRWKQSVTDLKKELSQLKDQLAGINKSNTSLESVKEQNIELEQNYEEAQQTISDLEAEIKRLRNSREESPIKSRSSHENLLKRQSSEDSNGSSNGSTGRLSSAGRHSREDEYQHRGHSNSFTELQKLHSGDQLSFAVKKKLSSSTSNLIEGGGRESIVAQLQSQLNRAFREKEQLSQQVSSLRDARKEVETRLKSLELENETMKEGVQKAKADSSTAQEHVKMLQGVAVQQTSESYEKNMQQQTHILELKTEKSMAEKQRDIALRERDRVVTDAIALKKKLETIKSQRQKDAKELANMRKLRDKAVHEQQEANKVVQESREALRKMEASYNKMVEMLKSVCNKSGTSKDSAPDDNELKRMLEVVLKYYKDYTSLLQTLYDTDNVDGITVVEAIAKIDQLYQERDNLVLEVEGLQRSASKRNEDYIFELKQTIESLYSEQDMLQGDNRSLLARIGKLEGERDKLHLENEQLTLQCSDMNSTLGSGTRLNEMWRKSMAHHWEQNWDLKHIQVPLGAEGKAGFSVVGGKDQPQLPDPGAFIVTSINKHGPANGILRIGDVLENVNGVNLVNANHSDAVSAVKESRGLLDIVLRRRKKANALQVGLAGAIVTLGEAETKKEPMEFSLMAQKDGVGFQYGWEAQYTVTDIVSGGPADKILHTGDKITQINGTPVMKEKPSAIKKLLKPQKGVLRLVVEREVEGCNMRYLTSEAPPPSVTEMTNSGNYATGGATSMGGATTTSGAITGHTPLRELKSTGDIKGSSWSSEEYTGTQNSQDNYMRYERSESHNTGTQESLASQEPVKEVSNTARLRANGRAYVDDGRRHTDTSVYTFPSARKDDFDDYSEIGSTAYSESISESFLSEPDDLSMDSSQTSIELTFHSISQVSHNRLTVQSTVSTQPEKDVGTDEDESYFDRDDGTRTTFRTRSGSDGVINDAANYEKRNKAVKAKKVKRKTKLGWRSGSLSQLSEPEYEQYHAAESFNSKKRSRSKLLNLRAKSRSNASLTPARSIPSVREEPRRSTSVTSVTSEQDPLADATYIRANFSYIPHHPQEMTVKPGDVFHIVDGAPTRHRRSFWVSRLNEDGTDAGLGAIPNTSRAQEWVDQQGEALDLDLYEEVEAYTGVRPVMVAGVLCKRIVSMLSESYPNLFHQCIPEFVEGTGRIYEARLHREQSEGKIIDYKRIADSGYQVLSRDAITSKDTKGKHLLIAGGIRPLHSLKGFAPPISILIKAGAIDSITMFGPPSLTTKQAQEMYAEARALEEQHHREFTSCLTLVYEETLLRQITDIVHYEKHNMTWVPVYKEPLSP